jgi:hypothetical protein
MLTFDPGAFGLVLQSTPAPTDAEIPLWDIGTLAPGAGGSIVVKIVNGAPVGAILSVSASGTASGGITDTDLFNVAAVGGGDDVTVINARYQSRPGGPRGPQGGVKLRLATPEIPLTFDGTQGVGITFTNRSQVLAAVYLPPGTLDEIDGRSGVFWKFAGPNPGPGGGKVFFRLRKEGTLWKMRAGINKYDVPISNTATIRMTVSLGNEALSAERAFVKQGGSPTGANSQRLIYKGD